MMLSESAVGPLTSVNERQTRMNDGLEKRRVRRKEIREGPLGQNDNY